MAKKKRRILIVEDDKDINSLLSYNLSRNGFRTESVYDGLVARDKLARENFDLVVLDIMLPGVDGFSICKMIKDNISTSQTPVVILSARTQALDIIYGETIGADCYITKPFSIIKLIEIVKELVV